MILASGDRVAPDKDGVPDRPSPEYFNRDCIGRCGMDRRELIIRLGEFRKKGLELYLQKHDGITKIFIPNHCFRNESDKAEAINFVTENSKSIAELLREKFTSSELSRIGTFVGEITYLEPDYLERVQEDLNDDVYFVNSTLDMLEKCNKKILDKHNIEQSNIYYDLLQEWWNGFVDDINDEILNAADSLRQIKYLREDLEENRIHSAVIRMLRITASSIKAEFSKVLFDGLRIQESKKKGGKSEKKLRGVELFVIELLSKHKLLNAQIVKKALREYNENDPWTREEKNIEYQLFLDTGGKIQHKTLPPSGKQKRKDITINTLLGKNYYLSLKNHMT